MIKNERVPELDSLRGLAALSVCFCHFQIFPNGRTGVDLFFMISGFVIYISLSHSKTMKQFWISRLSRLFPVYWLSILLTIIFCAGCFLNFKTFKLNDILGNILMLQPLFRSSMLNGVYWTLYIELVFYVFISLLWIFKLLKNIEPVILICFLSICVMVGLYILIGAHNSLYTRFFIVTRGILPLIGYFQFFGAGILFSQIYNLGISNRRILLLVFSFLLIILIDYNNDRLMHLSWHLGMSAVYYSLFILIVSKRAGFLNFKILYFLGYISYALYLIHATFGMWVMDAFHFTSTVFNVSAGIFFSLLLSYIITYYYDIPLRRFLKRNKYIKNPAQ